MKRTAPVFRWVFDAHAANAPGAEPELWAQVFVPE
jgi:hypothetical protein